MVAVDFHRLLFAAHPTPAWVYDRDTLRILDANAAACRHYGYTRDDFLSLTLVDLRPREEMPALLDALRRDAEGLSETRVYRHLKKDGTPIDVEITGDEVAFGGRRARLVLAVDVTERTIAVRERRESEERVRLIVDAIPSLVYVKDLEGRLTLVNQSAARAIGRPREEILGLRSRDLLPPRLAAAHEENDRAALGADVPLAFEEENEEAGSQRTYLTTKVALRDGLGRPFAVLGVSTDITARKRTERALEEARRELASARRMEALGRLAGGIAHDFNNLLNVLLGEGSLAERALPPGHACRERVGAMLDAARRGASLTRRLLAFARHEPLRSEPVDVNERVRGMEAFLARLLGERIALSISCQASRGVVRADPGQIDQVVLNLALNARDAMPAGGRLSIATFDAGERLALAVTDDGSGMDAATRERAFEPFFTTKPDGQGTGLGLSTVWGIAAQLGGEVRVESAPGSGSVFTLLLPSSAPTPAAAPAAVPGPSRASGRGERLLLVEDDPSGRDVIADVLREAGYDVLAVGRAEEALAAIAGAAAYPDLVLSDVVMPGMGGAELARQLAAAHPGVRVLLMSGYVGDRLLWGELAALRIAFLSKPFSPEELLTRVRGTLDTDAGSERG